MLLISAFACVQTLMADPATANYFCDFEDDAENAEWITWGGSTNARMKHSTWTTGEAAHYIGQKGMYITDPDIEEDNTHSYPKTGGYSVTVYRKMTLAAGSYTVSLDYRCPSELLSVSLIEADTLTANAIQTQTGADYALTVKNAIINGLKDLKSYKWEHASALHQVATPGTYLLAITYRTSTGPDLEFGAAVDNVELVAYQPDETACDYQITNMSLDYEDGEAILTWKGNADNYEVRCYDPENNIVYFDTVPDLGAADSCVFAIETIVSGVYQFMVRGLGCGGNGNTTGWSYLRVDISTRIAVACPEVNILSPFINIANGEKYVYPSCDGLDTIPLYAKVVAGGGVISGYRVDQVLYEDCPFPFSFAEAQQFMSTSDNYIRQITTDDVWDSQLLTLPFKVCFFNNTYSQAVVCSNGIVSFDTSVLGQPAGYSLTNQPDIPSPSFGQDPGSGYYWRNAIYGVFQDYDPAYGGEIWYGVLGEWPCRKMVVCWNEVPMFGTQNHGVLNSSMIVMYEGTNVIDVYVKHRGLSTDWNDNRGIIGIQNAAGTDGLAAPGRNTSAGDQNGRAWHADREAWRFSPIATPEYSVTWYKGAFNDASEIDTYQLLHPRENIVIDAIDSLYVTTADNIDAVTVRLQYSLCNGDPIDLLDQAHIAWPRPVNINVDTVICHDTSYSDSFVPYANEAGTYEVVIPDFRDCDSIIYHLNLTVLQTDTILVDTILCAGETLDYAGIQVTEPGVYPVRLKYTNCADCDSLVQIITLSALEPLSVAIRNDQTQVCGDDPVISLSYNVLSGRADKYDFVFDAEAQAAGFASLTNQMVEDAAEIDIPIMQAGDATFRRPGTYNALLTFYDKSECTDQSFDVQFDVLYPSSLIFQRWDDVLSVKSAQFNGGYEFTAYQWLQDGQPIEDAEQSYYYAPDKLVFTSEYQVLLTDVNGKQIITCPFTPQPSPSHVSVSPAIVRVGDELTVSVPENAHVEFYNMSGTRMMDAALQSGTTMLPAPAVAGVYVVRLTMEEGARSFRINVVE